MPMIRPASLFACAALPLLLSAQTQVRIVDPSALILRPDLGADAGAQAGLRAAGISPEMMQQAASLSDPARWPIGLRTDSARLANRMALRNYTAYLVCEYATEEGAHSIISVPAVYNYQMPEDLRAPTDIYLVLRSTGIEAVEATVMKEAPSKGPSWRNLRPARISRPDAVYATYDLAADEEAMAALEKAGLSKAEREAVVFRSHERNWPEGIDSFDRRYPRLKSFTKYKAFRLARWSDKVLVVVPAEVNRRAPEGVRPLIDIYMVFAADAVQVKEHRR